MMVGMSREFVNNRLEVLADGAVKRSMCDITALIESRHQHLRSKRLVQESAQLVVMIV